jgi:hypothetical protein
LPTSTVRTRRSIGSPSSMVIVTLMCRPRRCFAPDTTYAGQPTVFFSLSGASRMIAASKPSPAITTNRLPSIAPTSICRVAP